MLSSGDILVVDDDPLVAFNHTDILIDAGYNAMTANSLSQAWNAVSIRSFDLIICDHDLGDGKGLELLSRMVTAGKRYNVIYLSAALPEVLSLASKCELVRNVLTKPVDRETLLNVVSKLLHAADVPETRDEYPKLIGIDEREFLLDSLSKL